MPIEAKPLFRPDVLRPHLAAFTLPDHVAALRSMLDRWADLIASFRIDRLNEQQILPDFLTDFFVELLGYAGPTGGQRYTISREQHVEVAGKFADAVLGEFRDEAEQRRFVVAVEGKGPRDPLTRPFGGRRLSAVEQGYQYAVNLPCDWVIVTSIRQTRLYRKRSDQQTYEPFDTEQLASDDALLKKFVFLLGAERVVPTSGECHLEALFAASEQVGRELTKDFYIGYANMRQDAFEQLARDNPSVPRADVLARAQKLLDRVLFCAFAEDRGLLPSETIKRAFEHRDPYHPRPIWDTFRSLFGAINHGNAALGIHAYNGGLFADDLVLDGLDVSDEVCGYFRDLGSYDYRPPAQAAAAAPAAGDSALIDVDILGHIFEQSITDLELLRREVEGVAEPLGVEKHKTRRKKEGAFYTPAFITRYIVEQALGGVLSDRFEALRLSHEANAKGAAKAALADPRVYDLDALKKPQRTALVKFWEAWQDELGTVRLLDPACGSGAFLIEAFDQLHSAYSRANARLAELEGLQSTFFDLDKQILEKNLFGVDLNEEAIEICRLSLWIKTAQRGKVLTSLDETIRVGNSVVSDSAVDVRALDWRAAFPAVFAGGGFDVVIGNPPYIRHELLTAYKAHWEQAFPTVFAGTADIYVYFYALGLSVLRPGGKLAFVSSNAFARAGYAQALRQFFANETCVEQFLDLGDTQIFSDAKDVYPAIVVVRNTKPVANSAQSIRTLRLRRNDDASQVSRLVDEAGWRIPQARLSPEGWQFEGPAIIDLRIKLSDAGSPLASFIEDRFFRGIISGLNEAFVVDDETKDRIVAECPTCSNVLKPFVGGQDIRRWHIEPSGAWLIFFPNGVTDRNGGAKNEAEGWDWIAETYPPIAEHLSPFEAKARKRLDKGRYWWELRACDYYDAFEQPKIIYPDITKSNRFSLDDTGVFSSNTTYFLPVGDWFLLGVLNSKPTWFSLAGISIPFGERAGDFRYRLFSQYVGKLPVPDATPAERKSLADVARRCARFATERFVLQTKVQDRLLGSFGESSAGESLGKLDQKAEAWWDVTMNQLGDALKTSFKLPGNPFKSPRVADEWEPYLNERRAEIEALNRSLSDAEAEINDRVYRLFKLTPAEIQLLQREVEH